MFWWRLPTLSTLDEWLATAAPLLLDVMVKMPNCFPSWWCFNPGVTRKSSKMWVNWYCPSSLFMVNGHGSALHDFNCFLNPSLVSVLHGVYTLTLFPVVIVSHSSSVETDGSIHWNVHSKWNFWISYMDGTMNLCRIYFYCSCLMNLFNQSM